MVKKKSYVFKQTNEQEEEEQKQDNTNNKNVNEVPKIK